MTAADFFDKKELEKLPPGKRTEIIKKKQKELEEKLIQEAEDLEKETMSQIQQNKEMLDKILEEQAEVENRKKEEKLNLEQKVKKEDTKKEEKEKIIDYGNLNKNNNEYIPVNSEYSNSPQLKEKDAFWGKNIIPNSVYENKNDYI